MEHRDILHEQFSKQASFFSNKGLTLSSQEYLGWAAGRLPLHADQRALDVAAGTGHLSRAIAPRVGEVIAIDLTPAMLREGRLETAKAGLTNIEFTEADAAYLPFPDSCMDIVVSRLAIHHFEHPAVQLAEMVRVCKLGHGIGVVDLLSPDDESQVETYNRLERLRDSSHTTAFTRAQMAAALEAAGIALSSTDTRAIVVDAERWMEMTGTPAETAEAIRYALREDIAGRNPTGMRPFVNDGKLKFLQIWSVWYGTKTG
jgi:ubiquinone/menaquinone biosynthesis C-methylase UbiE